MPDQGHPLDEFEPYPQDTLQVLDTATNVRAARGQRATGYERDEFGSPAVDRGLSTPGGWPLVMKALRARMEAAIADQQDQQGDASPQAS